MFKRLLIVFFFAALALMLAAATQETQQQQPANPPEQQSAKIPADAAAKPNPVKPTAESLASGKKYYGYDCAFCHGDNGDGKGSLAIEQKLNLKDLRDPATLQGKTDGELYYLLKNGKGHMPLEPIRTSPNDLWNLINYVRSMSAPAKAAK